MSERKAIPDFELPATGNQRFRLSAFKGHPLILYFYPKDNTPGCTDESLQFRDLHAQFAKAGWAVFGVSRDSVASHEKFKAKFALPLRAAVGCRGEGLRDLRRHQDEEHVRQAGARHRAQHLRDRPGGPHRPRVARREGRRPCAEVLDFASSP